MANPTLDNIPVEKRIELVVRSVYEDAGGGPGGTDVIRDSVRNVEIGTPPNGWTALADLDSPEGRLTIQAEYDGDKYSDIVVLLDGKPLRTDTEDDERMTVDADEMGRNERLVLLAAKTIYEQSNWKILSLRDLVIDAGKGLTVTIVIENEDNGERAVLAANYVAATNTWSSNAVNRSRNDNWREDSGKRGPRGKRTKAPKCTKQACGMSCIPWSKTCHHKPQGVAEEALNQVVNSGGGGAGGGTGGNAKGQSSQSVPEKVPDTIADRNKPLYKAAIDGKQIRVTADQKNAAAPVTGDAGPWQDAKVDRIRNEKSKITKDEAAALAAYIGAKYAPMSAAIYAPGDPSFDSPESIDASNRLAANAMRKLDPITEDLINARARDHAARNGDVNDAPLYDAGQGLQRGITLNGQAFKDKIAQYESALAGDGLIREDTWFATSTLSVENNDVAIAGNSNVIYRIKPNLNGTGQGRYVDHFKNQLTEGEVLYPPYSQFRVTGVQVSRNKDQVMAEMGLTRDQQLLLSTSYNVSYFQQTFGTGWAKQYETTMGEKPPSASDLKKGLDLRQQIESQVTGSGITYIDLEEL
jgi:hypothetical protein